MTLQTHQNLAEIVNNYMDCIHVGDTPKLAVVATQKFNALHPIIRVNASELFVFRLRNNQDLQKNIDEVSALIDKQTLLEMYKMATKEAYSFLYIKLTAKDINDMFY